jgi:hypothetical protein
MVCREGGVGLGMSERVGWTWPGMSVRLGMDRRKGGEGSECR